MLDITSLGKVSGVTLNEWFIPTMFNALELDNSFVLWSSLESEYYADTTNNLLMLKFFNRNRRSWRLNIFISDDKIYIKRNTNGDYYPSRDKPESFRLPIVNDSLLMSGTTYLITNVVGSAGNILLEIENQSTFISNFTPNISFIDGTTDDVLYTDDAGIYYSKTYRSNNIADIYIDGTDIRSIAGRYL